MDKIEVKSVILNSPNDTELLGASIGRNLKGGELFELTSDLGGGKTTLTRGIVQGAGSHDHVSSPSFTIRNDYQAKDLSIAHFDFYRLSEPGILRDMLGEAITNQDMAVIIEWAQIVDDVLPTDHIKIELMPVSDKGRKAKISYPHRFEYLFKGVNDANAVA